MIALAAALLFAPTALPAVQAPAVPKARIAMADFARCTVDKSAKDVQDALSKPLGDAATRALIHLASNSCDQLGETPFDASHYRGALFTDLLRRREAGAAGLVTVAAFDPALKPAESDAGATQAFNLLWYADCVAKADRTAATAVALGPIGSAKQAAGYAAIQPHLNACLVEGSQVRFSKPVLEGVLAEVLYRNPA